MQGFGPVEQKDLRLQVDEHRELDFILTPASVTSTIEVSATEVAVQTSNPTLGQVITSEQVAQLPLNGRNFVQLATLTPDQLQKMEQMKAERKQRMEQRRQRWMERKQQQKPVEPTKTDN